MIGDIVGRTGRRALREVLPGLKKKLAIDFTIANGENAAGGLGITKKIFEEIIAYGVDIVTTGNHVWSKREILEFIDCEPHLLRPANYPPETPGMGANIFETFKKVKIAVINLAGRVFLESIDCPFRKADELLCELQRHTKIIIIDFHAEATSEKVAMGWYLDGKVSAICGTHTHVQTADEQVLPGGTAYITDLGMTGTRQSVIGLNKEIAIQRFLTKLPQKYEATSGHYQFNAVEIDIDEKEGRALNIQRIFFNE